MEYLRWIASGMILLSSTWVGLHAALRLRKTDEQLRELCTALERMTGELHYAGTPFVPLCQRMADSARGEVRVFFSVLRREAARPEGGNPGLTELAAREAGLLLPQPGLLALERLFDRFGCEDLETQVGQLRLAAEELSRLSEELRRQLAGKCRSYQLLGLTTGAAILVLVL